MRIVAPIPQQGGPRLPKKTDFFEKRKISSKTQKIKYDQKYAKISKMPFNQRSLIHREAWFPCGPRIPQHLIFFEKRKKSQKTQKLKNVKIYAKIIVHLGLVCKLCAKTCHISYFLHVLYCFSCHPVLTCSVVLSSLGLGLVCKFWHINLYHINLCAVQFWHIVLSFQVKVNF